MKIYFFIILFFILIFQALLSWSSDEIPLLFLGTEEGIDPCNTPFSEILGLEDWITDMESIGNELKEDEYRWFGPKNPPRIAGGYLVHKSSDLDYLCKKLGNWDLYDQVSYGKLDKWILGGGTAMYRISHLGEEEFAGFYRKNYVKTIRCIRLPEDQRAKVAAKLRLKKGEVYNRLVRVYHNRRNMNKVLKYLKKMFDEGFSLEPNIKDHFGFPLLTIVVLLNDSHELRDLLLSHGINVDERDKRNGSTPLMYAAQKGFLKSVRALSQNGADVNSTSDKLGLTVLGFATKAPNSPEVQRILVSKFKADPNVLDHNGFTLLTRACHLRQWNLARLLIKHGARIDDRDQIFGSTPIMYAAQKGSVEMVRELAQLGADISARVEGFARESKNAKQIVELLAELKASK